MSYRKPSTAVYQLLENAGGAANSSPDLEAVIIGPLYNVQKVDPADGVTLANTKSAEIPQWTDAASELNISSFKLPFNENTSYPGQEVLADSIQVFLTNVQVLTFKFDFDLKLNGDKMDKASFEVDPAGVSFGDAGRDPLTPMPGGFGNHVQPGDLIIGKNTSGAETESMVVAVDRTAEGKVIIRIADPINYTDTSVSLITSFSVYRTFNAFRVTDSNSIQTSDINALVPSVALSIYAKPFPSASVPGDYAFRSPAESKGGEAVVAHVGYRALRKDTVDTIMVINGPDDVAGKLGAATDENPLALGASIALKNTITSIKVVAVQEDSSDGYAKALDLLEADRVYFLTALTQDQSIGLMINTHCKQLSTPEESLWRMALINTAIPKVKDIVLKQVSGPYTAEIQADGDAWMLVNESSTFLSNGVTPGDVLEIFACSDSSLLGTHQVERVVNNQVLQIKGTLAAATSVDFEVHRNLTKREQAESVAAVSKGFNSNRAVHVMPDTVGIKIDGVMKYLPGYYLACGLAGMGAGFPVQQGFTNIGVVGIDDLRFSNYYFTREELNIMAGAGTCLFVQDTQGGIPYCRHELTTDMSVLEYREILKVKNWDYLSFFYKDLLDPFIGSWNITDDTITTMRQTIISGSERLMTQKLPKIGAPLISYNIELLRQNPTSLDTTDVRIKTGIVSPNNYSDVSLVI